METRCKASAFPQWLGSLRLPHFPRPRRRNHLQTINPGVGPFYSIGVGPFYVVKATDTGRGVVYGHHNPEWSWKPLSDTSTVHHGGQFNRRGIPALYTSRIPLTAIRGAKPRGRSMQPLTGCAYAVDAEPVFDALDKARRAVLGVSDSELLCPNWDAEMLEGKVPSSRALAHRLIAMGHAGMRVRSFAAGAGPDDADLVLWNCGADRPSRRSSSNSTLNTEIVFCAIRTPSLAGVSMVHKQKTPDRLFLSGCAGCTLLPPVRPCGRCCGSGQYGDLERSDHAPIAGGSLCSLAAV